MDFLFFAISLVRIIIIMCKQEWTVVDEETFRCMVGGNRNKYSVHNKYDQINWFQTEIYASLMGTIGRKCLTNTRFSLPHTFSWYCFPNQENWNVTHSPPTHYIHVHPNSPKKASWTLLGHKDNILDNEEKEYNNLCNIIIPLNYFETGFIIILVHRASSDVVVYID